MSTQPTPIQLAADHVGAVLGGRYKLLRVLGAGGMGAVYEAEDTQGARFAVKLLHGTVAGREAALRFAREARLTSALVHPNVTRVFDSGIDPIRRTPYLVMELLTGIDLEARLRETGPFEPSLAVRIVLRAGAAIEAAHAAGIIHRDIKPSNLFLHRRDDASLEVKVCDFGLAKQLFGDESVTQSGLIIGSPGYMSPEQAINTKRVDGRTDVWSLGVTLYEMLSDRTPFDDATSVQEILLALRSKDAPSIQDHAPWVSDALALVIHGALLRDLDARCPNIGAWMDALKPLRGTPDEIDEGMFAPLSLEVQSRRTPRADLPRSWSDVEANIQSMASPPQADSTTVRLLGRTLGGRYPLLGVLGKGGMGAVYATRGPQGEPLAVKVVRAERLGDGRKPETLGRFVREARAAMSITSEHVVKVIDADTDPSQRVPYIVMEHLDGRDLADLLRSTGALEGGPVTRAFVQACHGLAAAHRLGIVHRDIKPANIFLHELASGELVVKICDFGVAKTLLASDEDETAVDLTSTGGILGSPMYFSPEQARNAKNVDHRTDIFSLAISLYEALSGRRPWSALSSVGEIIVAVCTEDVPPLHEVAPWVAPELSAAVHRGLRRDPADRYATMDGFAAAIEPFASGPRLMRSDLVGVPSDKTAFAATQALRARDTTTFNASAVRVAEDAPRGSRSLLRASLAAALMVGVGAGALAYTRVNRDTAPVRAEPASERTALATSIATVEAPPTPSPGAVATQTPSTVVSAATATSAAPDAGVAKRSTPTVRRPKDVRPRPAVVSSASEAPRVAPPEFSNSRTE